METSVLATNFPCKYCQLTSCPQSGKDCPALIDTQMFLRRLPQDEQREAIEAYASTIGVVLPEVD